MNHDKRKITTQEMAVCGIMAALMCAVGPFTIPIGAVPISLLTLIIYLTTYLLDTRLSALSVLVYLLLGLAGLPVLAGGTSGVAKLVGPTGGYLIGYVIVALIAAPVITHFHARVVPSVIGLVAATAVLYLFGTVWYVILTGNTFAAAMSVCVLPFVPFDIIKIMIATIIGRTVRSALIKAQLLPEKKGRKE